MYVSMCVYIYIYIHIYIERERGREKEGKKERGESIITDTIIPSDISNTRTQI